MHAEREKRKCLFSMKHREKLLSIQMKLRNDYFWRGLYMCNQKWLRLNDCQLILLWPLDSCQRKLSCLWKPSALSYHSEMRSLHDISWLSSVPFSLNLKPMYMKRSICQAGIRDIVAQVLSLTLPMIQWLESMIYSVLFSTCLYISSPSVFYIQWEKPIPLNHEGYSVYSLRDREAIIREILEKAERGSSEKWPAEKASSSSKWWEGYPPAGEASDI